MTSLDEAVDAMLERRDTECMLRQAIAELEMVSQANAGSMDNESRDTSDDIGGRRPSGGIDRAGDRDPDFLLKSADYFKRRASRAYSERALQLVLDEARRSLLAWKHQRVPVEFDRANPQWKRWVAESELSAAEIARRHFVSRQYVARIRSAYRGDSVA